MRQPRAVDSKGKQNKHVKFLKNVIFALKCLNYLDAIQENYSLNVIFGKFRIPVRGGHCD
jgi:hypothetical protein